MLWCWDVQGYVRTYLCVHVYIEIYIYMYRYTCVYIYTHFLKLGLFWFRFLTGQHKSLKMVEDSRAGGGPFFDLSAVQLDLVGGAALSNPKGPKYQSAEYLWVLY